MGCSLSLTLCASLPPGGAGCSLPRALLMLPPAPLPLPRSSPPSTSGSRVTISRPDFTQTGEGVLRQALPQLASQWHLERRRILVGGGGGGSVWGAAASRDGRLGYLPNSATLFEPAPSTAICSNLLAQAYANCLYDSSLHFAPLCDQLFLLLFPVQCASCISTSPPPSQLFTLFCHVIVHAAHQKKSQMERHKGSCVST